MYVCMYVRILFSLRALNNIPQISISLKHPSFVVFDRPQLRFAQEQMRGSVALGEVNGDMSVYFCKFGPL